MKLNYRLISACSNPPKLAGCLAFCLSMLLLAAGCGVNTAQKSLREGLRELKRGNYQQSIRRLQQSLRAGGAEIDQSLVYNSLGIAYYRSGRFENALAAFESAAGADPQQAVLVYNLAAAQIQLGRELEALANFNRAAQMDLRDTRALEAVGYIHLSHERWGDARQAFEDARQRAPHEPRVLTALALVELKTANVARAISYLQEALSNNARYAPAIFNLAMINHAWLKNDKQALALFKDYVRLAPKGMRAQAATAKIALLDRKAPDDKPASEQVAVDTVSAQLPAAVPADKKPPPVLAPPLETAEPQVASASSSAEEWMQVARTLARQGRSEAAFNSYMKAARTAEIEQKPAAQQKALQAAAQLCEDNARMHYELGAYLEQRGENEAALAHFKQALQLGNAPPEAQLALARAAVAQNEFDAALVVLKESALRDGAPPEALWMLAGLYDQNLNLTNQALAAYELFAQRFQQDERAPAARERIKVLKNSAENVAEERRPASLWQKFFRTRRAETTQQ